MVELKTEDISEKEKALEALRVNFGALALFFLFNENPENLSIVRVFGRKIIQSAQPVVKIDELIIPINQREAVSIRREDCKKDETLSIYTLEEVMDIYYKETNTEIDNADMLRGIAQMAQSATFGT